MEQIRLYLDEHIPRSVAEGLRRRGVDVLTVQEAGRSGHSDADQLAFALAELRVLITMDSDFLILARREVEHAGIAYANPRRSVGEIIHAAIFICDVLTRDEMTNRVEYL